jgi:hypothetical protein
LPPRRCDDTWPARGWRTSSARPATDHQAADGAGVGLSVGVVDIVLLVFAVFFVVIFVVGVFVAFDDQRVFFIAFAVLVFVLVLKFVVIVLRLVLIGGGGGGVLLVQEVEVFESEISDGLHGASPS